MPEVMCECTCTGKADLLAQLLDQLVGVMGEIRPAMSLMQMVSAPISCSLLAILTKPVDGMHRG